jgi:hypothetical protein
MVAICLFYRLFLFAVDGMIGFAFFSVQTTWSPYAKMYAPFFARYGVHDALMMVGYVWLFSGFVAVAFLVQSPGSFFKQYGAT